MGEVLVGLETKASTHLSPCPATHKASMAPFQGSGPSLQDKVLYPESEAVLTLDRQPN